MPAHCGVGEGELTRRWKNMADGAPILPSAQSLGTRGSASIATAGFVNRVALSRQPTSSTAAASFGSWAGEVGTE